MKKQEMLLVVSTIDYAYHVARVDISYAGNDMTKAYDVFRKRVSCADRTGVQLDLVQGSNVKRLETHEYVK